VNSNALAGARQGLVSGCVIAKRPPLTDLAFKPIQAFKVDKALVLSRSLGSGAVSHDSAPSSLASHFLGQVALASARAARVLTDER